MFWSHELDKYVAYVRIDNYLPDPHMNDTCALGFRPARLAVGGTAILTESDSNGGKTSVQNDLQGMKVNGRRRECRVTASPVARRGASAAA
jgi:hypothetical protein